MKRIFTFVVACFSTLSLSAQISTEELPISFTNDAVELVLKNKQTDLKTMPSLDMARIQKEDERDQSLIALSFLF